jgi:hypothetical protein
MFLRQPTMIDHPRRSLMTHRSTRWLASAIAACSLLTLGSCNLVGLVAVTADKINQDGSTRIEAKYRGLEGKSFALLVTAPVSVRADYNRLLDAFVTRTTDLLRDNAGATGFVPGLKSIEFAFNRPAWEVLPPGEVAAELGVDQLIIADISEFRIFEVGNPYVYDGVATVLISVHEAHEKGKTAPSRAAYRNRLTVRFPDSKNPAVSEIPTDLVQSELIRRLSDRTAWLFYDHEEPNDLKY